jgi:ribosomal protein S27E
MRFLDVHVTCPRCHFALVSNERGKSRAANSIMRAVLCQDIGPYDTYAHYLGSIDCHSCGARLAVAFRDAIRRTPKTEVLGVRVLDPEEAMVE